jgi:hypothetical protein
MTLLPETLLQIAKTGASLRVDARKTSPQHMQLLAAEMNAAGGRLIVTNAQALTPDHAKLLAAMLGTQVEFDAAS